MSTTYSPRMVTDGLVLYLDAANPRSYVSGSDICRNLIASSVPYNQVIPSESFENSSRWIGASFTGTRTGTLSFTTPSGAQGIYVSNIFVPGQEYLFNIDIAECSGTLQLRNSTGLNSEKLLATFSSSGMYEFTTVVPNHPLYLRAVTALSCSFNSISASVRDMHGGLVGGAGDVDTYSFRLSRLTTDGISTVYGSGSNVLNNPITVTAWVKPYASAVNAGTWVSTVPFGANGVRFYAGMCTRFSSSLGIQTSPWTAGTNAAAGIVHDTEWHYQTLVMSSGTASVYDNGERVTEKFYTSYELAGYIQFGFDGGGGSSLDSWSGSIANPQIYNRALTEKEIQQNFNATRGRFGV